MFDKREALRPEERKLRIGVMLNETATAHWACHMLNEISSGGYAEISLVVLNAGDADKTQRPRSRMQRILSEPRELFSSGVRKALGMAQEALFERWHPSPDAFARKTLDEQLAGVPVVEVTPIRGKWTDRLSDADLRRIREFDLDVLIRLGFRVLKGDVLRAARYGIWSYHHGDNRVNRGGPPGFWEAMEGWPETGSILQILSEDLDNGTVLDRSFASTNAMSVRANRNSYFWKSASMLPRKLAELQRIGEAEFFARVAKANADPEFYSRPIYREPGNFRYAMLIARNLAKKIRLYIANKIYMNQWILMYHIGPDLMLSMCRYKRLIPPKDRFWADPHVLARDGKYYVFFEELPFATRKGHIAMLSMDSKGRCSDAVTVLDRPYHLSYPFVFEHEGDVYMIPESIANSTIELYRCTEFPQRWEFQENLMTGVKAVDTTLLFHEGKYWLFANMVRNPGASSWDELFVFHSDRPFGSTWIPHPMNPVVSDCKSARPAGALFSHRGSLYRPAQDCSRRYGYGLVLARIDVLNEREYKETAVSRAGPDWASDVLATHSFSRQGSLSVADAEIRVRR